MVKVFLPAFIFLLSAAAVPQSVTANAFTDTTDYLIGDYIPLTIKVKYDKGINIQNPSIKESLQKLELIKSDDPYLTDEDDKAVVLFKYIIAGYDSADFNLSPVPILYKVGNDSALNVAYTNPLSFAVHTLPVDSAEEIKDIKEPIKIPLEWWVILIYVLAALLVAALAYFLYRRHKKKKEEKARPEIIKRTPAWITALNSLHELEEQELWQKGLVKEYHSRITEIIRRYFEDRFYLPALELTTNEALKRLNERKEAFGIIDIIEQFLNNADLVKFAKYKPLASVNEEMMKQAYAIVENTIPKKREENKEVLSNAG